MDQTLEDAIRELLDRQEITDVIHRGARATDRGDQELLRSIYHPDAEDFHGIYNGSVREMFEGSDEMRSPYIVLSHVVSNIQIELAGDRAHVETYLSAVHRAQTPEGLRDDFLRCRYIDGFERRGGEWRIARRVVVYDWGESRPAGEVAWWDVAPGDYVFGSQSPDDRVFIDRAHNLRGV